MTHRLSHTQTFYLQRDTNMNSYKNPCTYTTWPPAKCWSILLLQTRILVSHPCYSCSPLVVVLWTIRPKMYLGLDVDINTWLFHLTPYRSESIVYTVGYPAQARGSGCMSITADLAHWPIKDLKLASDYYNKIFRHISGPPKWLTQNLRHADEPPHQICSYTLLFSLFLHFLYIADPPLCTSAPTWPHVIVLTLAWQSHLLHWTDLAYLMDIWLTIHMYLLLFLVSPMCLLLWSDQSWALALCGQALSITLPYAHILVYHLYLTCLYLPFTKKKEHHRQSPNQLPIRASPRIEI